MSGNKKVAKPDTEEYDVSWIEPGKKIWIENQLQPDSKEDIFQKFVLRSFDPKKKEVECVNQQGQTFKKELKFVYERAQDYNNDSYKGQEDMVNMEIINDAELLVNLSIRYKNNLIFTYVGPTLLVVNPFMGIPPLFTNDVKFNYIGKIAVKKGGHYKDLPPHVYAIGAEAFRCLFENNKNQAIVISGESGAGKTENAKFCMNLLTSIGQYQMFGGEMKQVQKGEFNKSSNDIIQVIMKKETSIEDKILSCNPILEAFGNAKTVRNNNSSRFGKYVRMNVDGTTKKIKGAEIINYLLEKSRITSHGMMERNFHIFYFFITGMSAEELQKYFLSDGKQKIPFDFYNYLKNEKGNYTVKAINDKVLYDEIEESVQVLGLQSNKENIFKVVAAILLLGNMDFDDKTLGNDTPCSLTDKDLWRKIGTLLDLSDQQVWDALTMRQIEVNKQIFNSPLTKLDCQNMRDSWAKDLYERLFNWLVEKLNQTIAPEEGSYVCVGLLDIYGFEVFDVNGFEQMMINYTNEKLHQLYIQYVFKEEETVFIAEGLQEFCGQIKFTDNSLVMDLLDKFPDGIFNLLDESCQVKSDDDQLLQKIRRAHGKNPLLENPKMISKPSFIVVHTAKDVEYLITGFREKNKDELSNLLLRISSQSTNPFIAKLFEISPNEAKKDKSLSKKVRNQMLQLMTELRSCDVHFVRCIKPNDDKVAQKIVQDYTLKQIRYLGVLDSLKVRKQNYPVRRNYEGFYFKYGDMTNNKCFPDLKSENANFRDLVVKMFKDHLPELGIDLVLFGRNRIFTRLEALPKIDRRFEELMFFKNKMATRIQKNFRVKQLLKNLHKFSMRMQWVKHQINKFRTKIYFLKSIKSCVVIQKWMKRKVNKIRAQKYAQQVQILQLAVKRYNAIKFHLNMKIRLIKLQRFTKFVIKMKQRMKLRFIKKQILISIDNAWLIIQSKRAIIIQRYARGYITRRRQKRFIGKIKEAGRQIKMRNVAVTIQKSARGYLIRRKVKEMSQAAYYIQGFMRMKWLSALFQLMREKARIIQYETRLFLARKHAMREKYKRYVLPMEERYSQQKTKEEKTLFGGTAEPDDQIYYQARIESDISTQSPFMHVSVQGRKPYVEMPQSQRTRSDADISCFDDILERELDPNAINRKMKLFGFMIDLEIFTDVSEYFPGSYSDSYKRLFEQSYTQANYMQTIHVGATHSFATTSGGKLYAWGMNDFGQLGMEILSLRPQKPTSLTMATRIKQIEAGSDHTLMLGEEGQVYICGSNEAGQLLNANLSYTALKDLELPFTTKQIAVTNHTSFVVSEDGRLFTWPVSNASQFNGIFQPTEMPLSQPVSLISTGNEFAMILTTTGLLYSFGENDRGELGLGHQEQCHVPQLVAFDRGQKVSQISCGFKHCIAKTGLGKVYVWGWGEFGQLGSNKFQDISQPQLLKLELRQGQITQVQAAHRTTIIMIDNSKLMWCGTNATISYQSEMCQVRLSVKAQSLCNGDFSPVRIMSDYSKTISIIYITFANHREMFKHQPGASRGVLQTLTQKWIESNPYTIDPPYIESISKYLLEQHQKLPLKKQPITRKETMATIGQSMHENNLRSPKASRMLKSMKSRDALSPKFSKSNKPIAMQFSDVYGEEQNMHSSQQFFTSSRSVVNPPSIQTQPSIVVQQQTVINEPSPQEKDKEKQYETFLQMEYLLKNTHIGGFELNQPPDPMRATVTEEDDIQMSNFEQTEKVEKKLNQSKSQKKTTKNYYHDRLLNRWKGGNQAANASTVTSTKNVRRETSPKSSQRKENSNQTTQQPLTTQEDEMDTEAKQCLFNMDKNQEVEGNQIKTNFSEEYAGIKVELAGSRVLKNNLQIKFECSS